MTQSSYNAASRTYSASSTSPARSALNPSNAPPGYRNGYKPRCLNSRVGTLELLIPQDRDGGFRTESFERYQRNERASVLSSMTIYLQYRLGKSGTETLCPASLSKSLVSELTHGRP